MKRTHLNLLLAIVTLMLLNPLQSQPAMAQKTFRARISKIASKQNGREKEIKKATDKVQYKRHRAADWVKAKKKDRLYDKDRVLMKPFTFAKLEMKGATVGATFTLWGDTTQTILPAAAYEIRKDPMRLGYYQLFVTYGSFVASNMRGMITNSNAMELTPSGTRYLMTVDRETGRTFVFVEEGEVIAVASGDTLHLRPMDAAQALPGGALEKVSLSVQETSTYLRQIRTNHIELWKHFRPWWQSPWFFGAAAAGAGVFAWKVWPIPSSDDDNQARGTITVSW